MEQRAHEVAFLEKSLRWHAADIRRVSRQRYMLMSLTVHVDEKRQGAHRRAAMRFKFDTLVAMSSDSLGSDCEAKMRGGVRVVRWRKAATA